MTLSLIHIYILAAKRGEELIPIPGGDYFFREGETMLVLGADRDVQKLSLIHIWNTKPIFRRRKMVSSSSRMAESSLPSTVTVPPVGRSSPCLLYTSRCV